MSIKRFQQLLIVQKVISELDQELGIKDKILAEFIVNLARDSSSVD